MSGKITFVGAGPGAPDLITLCGSARLAEADVVIYAGSLVNEKILELAPQAELYNSAKLDLPEVLELLTTNYFAGKKVVRLHTGDPAMYGAVSEQYRELDQLNIPYEVVPGVSSVFAAAAALKVELTMPELSQSVILTREAGRTPVPENESLEKLAANGTTLCIFLSVSDMENLCTKLISAGREMNTPVAVVYRASWENQMIVRGTLANIAEKVHAAGIKRQSMIIVGKVLDRDGALSKLYDTNFSTGYRKKDSKETFNGKVALFGLTRLAVCKAAEIAAGMSDATVFVPEKYSKSVSAIRAKTYPDGTFGATFQAEWENYDGFIMVMASGIVVRHLVGLCNDKKSDPAVVLCDEAGDYAVSLLSGHLGGGNTLARATAQITGGKPVITTASDVRKLPAFDEFAKRCNYAILSPEKLKVIAAAILDGEEIGLEMPLEIFQTEFAEYPQFYLKQQRNDGLIVIHSANDSLTLKKMNLVLGIGCRKAVTQRRIAEVVKCVLEKYQITMADIKLIASATVKENEAGLLAFSCEAGCEIRFFAPEELNQVSVPNPSLAAEKNLGINSVSEAAAILGAGLHAKLIIEKQADCDVTIAVAGGWENE